MKEEESTTNSRSDSNEESKSTTNSGSTTSSASFSMSMSDSLSESHKAPHSVSTSQSLRHSAMASLSNAASDSRSQYLNERESLSQSALEKQSQKNSAAASLSLSVSESQLKKADGLSSTSFSVSESQSARQEYLTDASVSVSESQSVRQDYLRSTSDSVSASQSTRQSNQGSISTSVSESQSQRYESLASLSNSVSNSMSERSSFLSSASRSTSDSIWNKENNNADDQLIKGDWLDGYNKNYLFDKVTGQLLMSDTDMLYRSPFIMYNQEEGYVKVLPIDPKKDFAVGWNYSFGDVTYKGKTYQIGDRIYDEAFKEGNFEGLKYNFISEPVTYQYKYGLSYELGQDPEEVALFDEAVKNAGLTYSETLIPGDPLNPPTEIPGYKLIRKWVYASPSVMPVPIDHTVLASGTTPAKWLSFEYERII